MSKTERIVSIAEQLRAQAEAMNQRGTVPTPGNICVTHAGVEIDVSVTPGDYEGNSTYSEISFKRNSREAIHVVRETEGELVLGITGQWEIDDITNAFRLIGGYLK
jgi:hypothetical protein